MRHLLLHPEVPDCDDCRRWVYDKDWKVVEKPARSGNRQPRPKGAPTPCQSCPKAIDRRPTPEADLSDRNWRAYQHYTECKAVGRFPDDAIVRRNAGLIRQVEEQAGRADLARLAQAVTAAAVVGGVSRGSRT